MAVDMVLRLLNVFYESNFYLKINFTIFSSVKKKDTCIFISANGCQSTLTIHQYCLKAS